MNPFGTLFIYAPRQPEDMTLMPEAVVWAVSMILPTIKMRWSGFLILLPSLFCSALYMRDWNFERLLLLSLISKNIYQVSSELYQFLVENFRPSHTR